MSKQIVDGLEAWRKAAERSAEETFLAWYGLPWLQAMLGMDANASQPPRKAAKDLLHGELIAARRKELESKISQGGLRAALARALLYVGMASGTVDERGFEAVQRLRLSQPPAERTSLAAFKALIREQFFMLLIDEEKALTAIPQMLTESAEDRRAAFAALTDIVGARGALPEDVQKRLDRVAGLFRLGEPRAVGGKDQTVRRKAS
jgi:hypothetical protein